MAQYLDFMIQQWMLSGLLLAVLIAIVINELRFKSLMTTALNNQQAIELINHQQAIVIDIREPDLFRQGHLLRAMNLPYQQWQNKKSKLNKFKQKPLIIVCAQGLLSPKVVKELNEDGFESVYRLSGGITSWQQEQYPLSKEQ
tara:strand:+ start:248 stop:676 length:429 start_codon:yes stop_codon:yes gene_type:complete